MPVLKIVETVHDLEAIESEWESFRTQVAPGNLCVSWLWISTWSQQYLRAEDKLFIHIYYDKQAIIGIFPVYLKKISCGYQLRFVATGECKDAEICSEFQDFIIESREISTLLPLFNNSISNTPNLISYGFDNVLNDSIAGLWVNEFFCHKWAKKRDFVGVRYLLVVEKDQSTQINALKSKTTRRQAKQYIASLDCHCEHLTESDTFDVFFSELMELHNKSWRDRGKCGVFENEKFRKFHIQYARAARKKNKLVMFKVCNNEEILAIFYGVIDGKILHYYQSGIVRSKIISSAGIAMHIEALNIAQNNMLEQYDLMKGKLDSYKKRIVEGNQQVFNFSGYKKQYFWLPYALKLKSLLLKIVIKE